MKKGIIWIVTLSLLSTLLITPNIALAQVDLAYAIKFCPNCTSVLIYEGRSVIGERNHHFTEHYDAFGNYLHDDFVYQEIIEDLYFCSNCVIWHPFYSYRTVTEHNAEGLGK